jgi:hypothetical protein
MEDIVVHDTYFQIDSLVIAAAVMAGVLVLLFLLFRRTKPNQSTHCWASATGMNFPL